MKFEFLPKKRNSKHAPIVVTLVTLVTVNYYLFIILKIKYI